MDLYIIDDNWVKQIPIDGYFTLIWTERYNQYGDATLTFPDTAPLNKQIVPGVFLMTPESPDVVLIDTVTTDPDSPGILTAVGQTLTGFLVNRFVRNRWQTTDNSWTLIGSVGQIAAEIVKQMCVASGTMDGGTVVPNGSYEIITGLSTSAYIYGELVSIAVDYGTVYDAVKSVCDQDDVGFWLRPLSFTDGSGNTRFTTYKGVDRTTDQTDVPAVIFDPALDSLTNINRIYSIAQFYNVAYVWPANATSQSQIGVAYAPGGNAARNWTRRTLMVDASDSVDASKYGSAQLSDLQDILNQKGVDALANNNYVRNVDGTIVQQNSLFKYGKDYFMGDIIELRDDTNVISAARIVEYIRSQDETGFTEYPTLSVIS